MRVHEDARCLLMLDILSVLLLHLFWGSPHVSRCRCVVAVTYRGPHVASSSSNSIGGASRSFVQCVRDVAPSCMAYYWSAEGKLGLHLLLIFPLYTHGPTVPPKPAGRLGATGQSQTGQPRRCQARQTRRASTRCESAPSSSRSSRACARRAGSGSSTSA